jgi:hypothetical protein
MSDSALSVRFRKFRYQAQSDIADDGYRTKCPPVGMTFSSTDKLSEEHVKEGYANLNYNILATRIGPTFHVKTEWFCKALKSVSFVV